MLMFIFAPILCMFPKTLPKTALKRKEELLLIIKNEERISADVQTPETSLKGLSTEMWLVIILIFF